jgi:UDP-N-acetyl-D-galactosamine dehydrogenase
MPKLFADYLVKQCFRQGYRLSNKGVLILGLSFKENIPDFRNSKSVDLLRELESYGIRVSAYDPHIDAISFANDHENAGISVINEEPSDLSGYDAIVLAVSHNEFLEKSLIDKLLKAKKTGTKIFDLKNLWQNYTDLSDWSP